MSTSSQKVSNAPSAAVFKPQPLPTAGAERLKSDYRMYGGLLLTLGICAAYGSFADIATLDSPNSALQVATLVAAILQAVFGLTCMFVGLCSVVMDIGNTKLTTLACVCIQLAWCPFLVGLTTIGMGIVADPSENPWIPAIYNPTASQVKFVGSMAFFGLIAAAIGMVGSLAFFAFSMHAIQAGNPEHRSGLYFRGRAKTYNGLLMLAGFAQLAIGSFIINKYGNGPLAEPINAFVYAVIYFPEISVTVGLVQMIVGFIGIARSLRKSQDKESTWFQALCFFMYICIISMQILAQVAYAPGGTAAAAAPSLACVYFGLSLMPAFLDWKMNHVANDLEGYYDDLLEPKQELFLEMEQSIKKNNSNDYNFETTNDSNV